MKHLHNYITIIYLHTNIQVGWGKTCGIAWVTLAKHTSYTSSWWKCGTSKSKRHLVASCRSPEDKYSCRSNVIWRVRYFTGRSPPPTPHTLSSRTNPCFIERSVSARDRACLHHRNTKPSCYAVQFPDLLSSELLMYLTMGKYDEKWDKIFHSNSVCANSI